jgi:hypothetical protein
MAAANDSAPANAFANTDNKNTPSRAGWITDFMARQRLLYASTHHES